MERFADVYLHVVDENAWLQGACAICRLGTHEVMCFESYLHVDDDERCIMGLKGTIIRPLIRLRVDVEWIWQRGGRKDIRGGLLWGGLPELLAFGVGAPASEVCDLSLSESQVRLRQDTCHMTESHLCRIISRLQDLCEPTGFLPQKLSEISGVCRASTGLHAAYKENQRNELRTLRAPAESQGC